MDGPQEVGQKQMDEILGNGDTEKWDKMNELGKVG